MTSYNEDKILAALWNLEKPKRRVWNDFLFIDKKVSKTVIAVADKELRDRIDRLV